MELWFYSQQNYNNKTATFKNTYTFGVVFPFKDY